MRRLPAPYSHPEQLCWISSFQQGKMGFDPGFLGFEYGIENCEQFAHGRDEGDLLGSAHRAQVPVELTEDRIALGGG